MRRRSSRVSSACAALATALLVFGVVGLAPAAAAAQSDAEGELTVLDWAGFDEEAFWADFKQGYPDVDVTFEMGASDADIFAKMAAGDQADVFHPYSGWLQFYVDEGLVEEIDTSKLTNWDKVPERFKQVGQIDGKQYFVPFDWGYSSILYRTDMIPEGVTSWSALLDPAYSGHIAMYDDGASAVGASCRIRDWEPTEITAEQLDEIEQEWLDQKEQNLYYWTSEVELAETIASGDVWAAYAWQGAYAILRAQGVPVAYADPEEGRSSWIGYYGIRKGTDNYDLALAFLDAKLGKQTGDNLVSLFYYGHSSQEVLDGVTDPELIEVLSLNDPTVLDRTHFSKPITAEQRDAWAEMWLDVKAG